MNPGKIQATSQPPKRAEDLRAQRVWLILDVMALTWGFFALYLWFRGYSIGATAGLIECVFYGFLALLFRRSNRYRLVMEVFLVGSGFGVVAVASSHTALNASIFYFPISIMVASQLFGVRPAGFWLVVTIIMFTTFFLANFGIDQAITTWRLDDMIISVGVAICLFFCVQQAESHYQSTTNGLVELSDRLTKKAEKLEILATTDALTGLKNRFQFQQDLADQVATCESNPLALFLIDMDGFKEVNDTLGHPIGDAALVEIGRRLQNTFGEKASVSRLGGDEFCVIYPGIVSQAQAEAVAAEIYSTITKRYDIDDVEIWLGTSIGFALAPQQGSDDQNLLAFADVAMFHAKENGLMCSAYNVEMTETMDQTRVLKAKLLPALANDEFFLVYQPQVNIESGELVGVEALLRWRHDGEVISPAQFIPLLEQSGKITEVGRWIIREACRQQSLWSAKGRNVKVSINLSAIQFRDPKLVKTIADAMKEFHVRGSYLDFEITEGALIDDVEQTVAALDRIRKLGASVSIDDFGTGYSSLAYLRRFPIDRLKIDRAFVKDIPETDDGTLAASIIVLGESLGLTVLAEGVETKEQLDTLRNFGCDEYQGYYLSRPVPANEIDGICNSLGIAKTQSELANV